MNIGQELASILEKEGLTQQQIADRAGVTQPTVSRALHQTPVRDGQARRRLVRFIQDATGGAVAPEAEPSAPEPELALRAVKEIWDGSDAHAAALASLVRASAQLWPSLGQD